MSTLKEFLGGRFEQFVDAGKKACFIDHHAEDMSRDELLALVGWLGERHQDQHRQIGDIIRPAQRR